MTQAHYRGQLNSFKEHLTKGEKSVATIEKYTRDVRSFFSFLSVFLENAVVSIIHNSSDFKYAPTRKQMSYKHSSLVEINIVNHLFS